MTITDELLQKGLKGKNGITRDQAHVLGMGWPLKKGWRKRIVNREYSQDQYDSFIGIRRNLNNPAKAIPVPVATIQTERQLKRAARRKSRKAIRAAKKERERNQPKERVEYFQYMKSSAWRRRSKKCISEAGFQCEVCSGIEGGLAAHHYNYLNLGNETRLDLFCLCSSCHSDYHSAFPAKLLPQDKDSSRHSRLYHLTLEIARYRVRPAFSGREIAVG